MDRRQGLVSTFILFAALALLLACSRFTSVPGAANPTSSPQVTDIDYWKGWERASWIATVLGFPIAIIAISIAIVEQKRIVEELRRRPRLSISFELPQLAHKHLKLEPRPGLDGEGVGVVHIVVLNNGTRSASQLSSTIAIHDAINPAVRSGPSQVAEEDRVTFMRNPNTGGWIAKREEPYVHVGMASLAVMPLIFPYENRTYEFVVAVHCAEIERVEARLLLTTEARRRSTESLGKP